MKCFYDGSQEFLKGKLCSNEEVTFKILTDYVTQAKLVYTEQIYTVFNVAKKISVPMA